MLSSDGCCAARTQWPAQPKELSAAPPPWADRRDTLNYSLELVSSSPQEAARRFSMTLSVDTQEVGIVEQPNIELVRTLHSLVSALCIHRHLTTSLVYEACRLCSGVSRAV